MPRRVPMGGGEPHIRKADVLAVTLLRARLEALTKESKLLKADLDVREQRLIALLKAEAPVEAGTPRMAIAVETGRRTVAWREAYEQACGKLAAEALLAAAVPPSHERLVIEDS